MGVGTSPGSRQCPGLGLGIDSGGGQGPGVTLFPGPSPGAAPQPAGPSLGRGPAPTGSSSPGNHPSASHSPSVPPSASHPHGAGPGAGDVAPTYQGPGACGHQRPLLTGRCGTILQWTQPPDGPPNSPDPSASTLTTSTACVSVCPQGNSFLASSVLTVTQGPSPGAERATADLGQSESWWAFRWPGGRGRPALSLPVW